jgi:hypothetical protein
MRMTTSRNDRARDASASRALRMFFFSFLLTFFKIYLGFNNEYRPVIGTYHPHHTFTAPIHARYPPPPFYDPPPHVYNPHTCSRPTTTFLQPPVFFLFLFTSTATTKSPHGPRKRPKQWFIPSFGPRYFFLFSIAR